MLPPMSVRAEKYYSVKRAINWGKAGIVVPIMDFHALAEGIIKIITNKRLHDQMSAVGEARVKQLYTRERFINNYRNTYAAFEREGIKNGRNRV